MVLAAATSTALAQPKPIPQLVKKGAKFTFLVDGKHSLMSGDRSIGVSSSHMRWLWKVAAPAMARQPLWDEFLVM
jgi:hypothetical protein